MKIFPWMCGLATSAVLAATSGCSSGPQLYVYDVAHSDGELAADATPTEAPDAATATDAAPATDTTADEDADIAADTSETDASGDTTGGCSTEAECDAVLKPGLCEYTRCVPDATGNTCQLFKQKDGMACADAECLVEAGSAILQGRLCSAGQCGAVATTVSCDDKDNCTLDTCNIATGCAHSILPCNDGDPCTKDGCDPASGCVFPPDQATPCDDGNACSVNDKCSEGSCVGGAAKLCPAATACHSVACNPATGACEVANAPDGSACDDGNSCTKQDTCGKGICIGAENPCDDGNVCTFDGCSSGSCSSKSIDGVCDLDGSACTMDLCVSGVCAPGAEPKCDDGNLCTIDSCDPTAGCVHKAEAFATPCAANKWCGQGMASKQCVAVTPPPGMVYVPAATVSLGCNTAVDSLCNPDEKPSHPVALASYFVDITEATVAQYQACVQGGACVVPTTGANATYGGVGKGSHPVNYVNWTQAATYCLWAGGSRLCSEAEWEYAARGSDGRRFPWGNIASTACDLANWGGACGGATPVGQFAKGNAPFGQSDMAGNVREWTSDWYASGYYAQLGASGSASFAPSGPASGTARVVRGGYFSDNAPEIRTSARALATPQTATFSIGIRCCRTPK